MIPNLPSWGKFIVFEGIDGCGKTTQLLRTYHYLHDRKLPVRKTKEPNKSGIWGAQIDEELAQPDGLHKTDPFGFQTWYACDSKENLREAVIPALRARCVVLSDRFRPSMVYGAKDASEILALMLSNQIIIGEDFIWPDVILIFDVSVETAIKRLEQKDRTLDEHENKKALLEQVRANYLAFAKMYPNCHIIDGEKTPEEIFNEILPIITKVIKPKPRLVV